jgi:hypothetical protein
VDHHLAREVLRRLTEGASLGGLGLGVVGDRIDLSGLVAPDPLIIRESRGPSKMGGLTVVRGRRWTGLDLSKARLPSLRFYEVDPIF